MPSLAEKALFTEILGLDNVMILTHLNPDGDTVATAFALKRVYENRGKRAFVANCEALGKRISFLAGGALSLPDGAPFDAIVAVDTATAKLLGEPFQKYADRVDYCIDHHITNSYYAKKTLVRPTASSAGEYLYDLLRSVREPVDRETAELLYAAVSFDTGCFKYSNVTPHTMRTAASLLSYGIPAEEINRRLFDIASFEQLRIEHEVLLGAERHRNGTVTLLMLTQEMLRKVGPGVDAEGISALCRRIEGTVVGLSMREMPDGLIKVSLRSMDDRVDVSAIAKKFGGGGHVRASGCSFRVPLEEARKQLLEGVLEEMDRVFGKEK